MQVTLTSQLDAYVKTKLRTGRYLDPSEVIREALRRWEESELKDAGLTAEGLPQDQTAAEKQTLRRRIANGLAQIDRGDYVEYAGESGVRQLAADVKARGRVVMSKSISRKP